MLQIGRRQAELMSRLTLAPQPRYNRDTGASLLSQAEALRLQETRTESQK